ncbi:hypothetical protein N658DRAFT_249151 [Parathielavia hyrcaniae]|uniref:Uncharacterized protein n=1 Tax=Parathielavia hyrcaniae TaxID=113614 RepID=A0AAN6Q9N4_9PEZI|nr:hypothetical protein N658DRAFT_249151 [Parathielavia hyrcaniae]
MTQPLPPFTNSHSKRPEPNKLHHEPLHTTTQNQSKMLEKQFQHESLSLSQNLPQHPGQGRNVLSFLRIPQTKATSTPTHPSSTPFSSAQPNICLSQLFVCLSLYLPPSLSLYLFLKPQQLHNQETRPASNPRKTKTRNKKLICTTLPKPNFSFQKSTKINSRMVSSNQHARYNNTKNPGCGMKSKHAHTLPTPIPRNNAAVRSRLLACSLPCLFPWLSSN